MDARPIRPARGRLDAALDAPPSKSVTHRALIAAALASGRSTVHAPLDADDTRTTFAGLSELGLDVREERRRWIVEGCGGAVPGGGKLSLNESGTSLRFLVALAALGVAPSELDGSPRLRERPIQELAAALVDLGAEVRLGPSGGGLPVRVGGRPPRGGRVRVSSSRSSQFASALLLVAPRLPDGLDLTLEPPVVSLPYIRLTAGVLADFGVSIEQVEDLRWRVPPQDYGARDYSVEGDHSSASYFLAAACIVGGRVRVRGLSPQSAQSDAVLVDLLDSLGCEIGRGADWIEVSGTGRIPGFDLHMGDAPDLVPTMAVLGLFADGPCAIRGVAHLRLKESDRLEMLASNLRLLGRAATAEADRLTIGPPPEHLGGGQVPTASDHRMAMAFAVAGLRLGGVTVEEPGCVAKSNPAFWTQFEKLEG
jgi:3-phosphoshikimate 1-carboxyvinyltransferase